MATPVRPACATEWILHEYTDPSDTAARIASADVVFTNKTAIGTTELESANKLKLIVVAATGYNIIDIAACAQRDIAVANSPGYSASSVPEHNLALILTVARSIVPLHRQACDGTWSQAQTFCLHTQPIIELRGRTAAIIGSGSLGRATGELCAKIGMRVIYLGRAGIAPRNDGLVRLPWAELITQADVLSLHCPLVATNRHMLDATALAQMKRSAIVINTARGDLIDYPALIQALTEGRIAGAGIDVIETEPPPADHPLLQCQHPGLVLTPHVAWASAEAQARLLQMIADTADAFFAGRSEHLVS